MFRLGQIFSLENLQVCLLVFFDRNNLFQRNEHILKKFNHYWMYREEDNNFQSISVFGYFGILQ